MARYKVNQRVKVDNRNSTFPNDNKGVVLEVRYQYVVKLDGGLVGLFDAERITKETVPKYSCEGSAPFYKRTFTHDTWELRQEFPTTSLEVV